MTVYVNNRSEEKISSRNLITEIDKVAQQILERYDLGHGEVSITLADDRKLQDLNSKYRRLDEPTDVLAFGLLEPGELQEAMERPEEQPLMGDIYISVDRAKDQAAAEGHGLEREILTLTVHGMLHLLGYDHADDESRIIMREMEAVILNNLE